MASGRNTAALALVAIALAGCGGDEESTGAERESPAAEHPPTPQQKPAPRLPMLRCPSDLGNCRSARGTVVYVEAVDPDGDGDAHFVLASKQAITGPGISVIDVERGLRPAPLPRVGDEIAAAGPVYKGSYGQRQIQALKLRVRRR